MRDLKQSKETMGKDCQFCRYWMGKKAGCCLENCIFPEKEMPESLEGVISCKGCPYGRASPCIGYCMEKIIWELRLDYGRGR